MTRTTPTNRPHDDTADTEVASSSVDGSLPFDGNDPVARFTIPRLPGAPGVKKVRAALRQAIDHRMGVVVTGPLGVGKSEGAHAAVAWFGEQEHRASLEDSAYRRGRVVYVHLRTVRTERQLAVALLKKATPGRTLTRRSSQGSEDTDDLRERLYQVYRAQNVVALILDDAQRLTDGGLRFARDLIATREIDPHRVVAGPRGPEAPAVGIGVVLIGTPDLEKRVLDTHETHGHGRWAFRQSVAALAERSLPLVYEHIFPAFAAHIDAVGRSAWEAFIAQHVSLGRTLPIRTITTHAREYFARLYDHTRGAVTERDAAPFERTLFLETLRATLWEPERLRNPDTTERMRVAPDASAEL